MKFERIDTPEKLAQWKAFASTFDHDADNPLLPLVMIINDKGQAIGHFHVLSQPVIFPAFHPSVSNREFKEACEAVTSYITLSSMSTQYPNGVMFVAVDEKNGFPKPILEKLGFKNTGFELHQRIP